MYTAENTVSIKLEKRERVLILMSTRKTRLMHNFLICTRNFGRSLHTIEKTMCQCLVLQYREVIHQRNELQLRRWRLFSATQELQRGDVNTTKISTLTFFIGPFAHNFSLFLFMALHFLLYCPLPFCQPTSPPPPHLSSTCAPAEGKFQRRGNPPGQPGSSQMVSKLHLHYLCFPLLHFLWSLLQNYSCSCHTSHLTAAVWLLIKVLMSQKMFKCQSFLQSLFNTRYVSCFIACYPISTVEEHIQTTYWVCQKGISFVCYITPSG